MSFGEIRSAVNRAPSRDGWNALFTAIAQSGQPWEELRDYVVRTTAAWPDEVKVVPQAWLMRLLDDLDAAMKTLPCQALALCKVLRLDRAHTEKVKALDWVFMSDVAPHLTQIDAEELHNPRIVKSLQNLSPSVKLERLSLASCQLERAHLSVLSEFLESASAKDLEMLNLDWNVLGDGSAKVLCRASTHLNKLKVLQIEGNEITKVGARGLFDGLDFAALEQLNMGWNDVEDTYLEYLAQRPWISRCTRLGLEHNSLRSAGVIALFAYECFEGLREFNAYTNWLNDGVALALANNPSLHNLEVLNLNANQVSERGEGYITQSAHLRSLKQFVI